MTLINALAIAIPATILALVMVGRIVVDGQDRQDPPNYPHGADEE